TERGGVGACEHERNARHRARPGDVGDAETRMRMWGAQHDRVQAARRCVIGDVAPGAAQERVVLLAPDRLTGAEFGSGHGPYVLTAARSTTPASAASKT